MTHQFNQAFIFFNEFNEHNRYLSTFWSRILDFLKILTRRSKGQFSRHPGLRYLIVKNIFKDFLF